MIKNLLVYLLFLIALICNAQNRRYLSLGVDDRIRNHKVKVPDNIKYPDCNKDDYVYQGAGIFSNIEKYVINSQDVVVTDSEVNNFGDESFNEIINSKKFRFIKSGRQLFDLKHLLAELLAVRKKPSGIKYQVHLVEDSTINAFTVGGHIIITTGIIKEAGSLSAVASILGHEIGHNEKGHIINTIKKIKIAKQMGYEEVGEIGVLLQHLITPAFNQPNEIEADYYGVDLAYAAGFNPKAGLKLWKKLSKREHMSTFNSFMRSHPYSINRYYCIMKYIKINYNL